MSPLRSYALLRRLRVVAAGIALTALVVPNVVSAHSQSSAQSTRFYPAVRGGAVPSPLGTWRVAISPAGASSFEALVTFTSGGGLIETESDFPGSGLGSWTAVGHGRFAITIQSYNFASFGRSLGSSVVRSVITLRSNSWSGSFETLILNSAGKRLTVLHGKETARRFRVQLPGS